MEKQKIIDLWIKHGGTVQTLYGTDGPDIVSFVYIDLDGLERFLADVKNGDTVADKTDDAGILIRPSIKIE